MFRAIFRTWRILGVVAGALALAAGAAQAQDAGAKDTFKKAWGACLEGRG